MYCFQSTVFSFPNHDNVPRHPLAWEHEQYLTQLTEGKIETTLGSTGTATCIRQSASESKSMTLHTPCRKFLATPLVST